MHCLLTILLHILISGNNHTDDHTYRHHNHHAAVSRGKIWISVNHQKTNSFSIFPFLPLRNSQTASQAYQFRPTFSYLRIFIRKRRCQRRRIAELAVRSTDIMALQLHVEKLRGLDNYKAWSMTVRSYLETEDLWSVVSTGPDGSDEVRILTI